jgi:hypothetical protein
MCNLLFLGFKDTDTIRHGIFEIEIYDVYSRYNPSNNSYAVVDSCGPINATLNNTMAWQSPDCAK